MGWGDLVSPLVVEVCGCDEVGACFGHQLGVAGDVECSHLVPQGWWDGFSLMELVEFSETLVAFGGDELFSLVEADIGCFDHVVLSCHCAVSSGIGRDVIWWEVS